jgi:hypothetical protein
MNEPVTASQIMQQRRGEAASQATSIEQSRAVAEVQGALVVAQQRPRDETKALAKAMESCRQMAVAESAFFKFPRGGQTVAGETIHLAVELARCWGNIAYGIMELDRDDFGAKSEMLAFAWDLETNSQSRMTFIVPHKRDKRGGAETLTDMRDIYENNANMGARRLRECIYRVLPPYLKENAKATCYATLEKGEGDQPLPVRVAAALDKFQRIGIGRERIEAKLGRVADLTAADLANLEVAFRSIRRNEVSADEEFPRVGVDETTAAARQIADKVGKAEPKDERQDTVSQSNPAAAEGKGDDDRGESHSDDDTHPAQRVADEIIAAAGKVANIVDLTNLRALKAADIAAMPDEIGATVTKAFDAVELKLRRK